MWCELWTFVDHFYQVRDFIRFLVWVVWVLSWKGVGLWILAPPPPPCSCFVLFFTFFLLLCLIAVLNVFHVLNQPCISKVNPSWMWSIFLFICFYIYQSFLSRVFVCLFIRINRSVVLLCVVFLPCFDMPGLESGLLLWDLPHSAFYFVNNDHFYIFSPIIFIFF